LALRCLATNYIKVFPSYRQTPMSMAFFWILAKTLPE